MGDDRGQRPGQGGAPSRGSIVLTPPGGIPVGVDPADAAVRDDVRAFLEASPQLPAPQVPGPRRPVGQAPVAPCLCGHDSDVHRHWRPGSDCGTCGTGACTAYRPQGGTLRRLLHGLGLID